MSLEQLPKEHSPTDTDQPAIFGAEYVHSLNRSDVTETWTDHALAQVEGQNLRSELRNMDKSTAEAVHSDLLERADLATRQRAEQVGGVQNLSLVAFENLVRQHVHNITSFQERVDYAHETVLKDNYRDRVLQAIDKGLIHWTAFYGLGHLNQTSAIILDSHGLRRMVNDPNAAAFVRPAERAMYIQALRDESGFKHYWDHEAGHMLSTPPPENENIDGTKRLTKKEIIRETGLNYFPLDGKEGRVNHVWVDEAQNEIDTQVLGDHNGISYRGQVALLAALKHRARQLGVHDIDDIVGEARYGHVKAWGVDRQRAKIKTYNTLSAITMKAGLGTLTDIELDSRKTKGDIESLNAFFLGRAELILTGMGSASVGKLIDFIAPHHAQRRQALKTI